MNMDGDVKELSEVLEVVSEKVPGIISGLFNAIYSPKAGAEAGKSVGNFYTNLLESGIPEDIALKLTERYMFSIKDIMGAVKSDNECEE